MGKITGFKEYTRKTLTRDPIEKRLHHYKEFEHSFKKEDAEVQAARCMDCGVAFCHGDTGCPVDNLIPEWNDLIYKGHWKQALENLHSTNNFPEFTGRLCPAPCESACVLGINEPAVSIKAIERSIVDYGFEHNFIQPLPPNNLTGFTVAIIGSGPAGLACAQQLARMGHKVTVFEKNNSLGGLLRYGIPDFKMEKWLIDRRIEQMLEEGVIFKTNTHVGKNKSIEDLMKQFDAIVLAGGSEKPRDLPISGRNLNGIHFAMDFLTAQNKKIAGEQIQNQILATGKNVVIIGGGDTGSDCVGTSNRQKAESVSQLEIFTKPPNDRSNTTPWPYWPLMLRNSSSHEEGADRLWGINSESFVDDGNGHIKGIKTHEVEFKKGSFVKKENTEKFLPADLVLLAMGFVHPIQDGLIHSLKEKGLELDERGNIKAEFGDSKIAHQTSVDKVFACGDIRRGQSLIVWAIAEGRKCASSINAFFSRKKLVS